MPWWWWIKIITNCHWPSWFNEEWWCWWCWWWLDCSHHQWVEQSGLPVGKTCQCRDHSAPGIKSGFSHLFIYIKAFCKMGHLSRLERASCVAGKIVGGPGVAEGTPSTNRKWTSVLFNPAQRSTCHSTYKHKGVARANWWLSGRLSTNTSKSNGRYLPFADN